MAVDLPDYVLDVAHPPYLLTPGPLNTSASVKTAMLKDWGSRDQEFRDMTAKLRARLLEVAGGRTGDLECVPVQGSGTFAVEAMLGSLIPPNATTLVLINGAYGHRMAEILRRLGRAYISVEREDSQPVTGEDASAALDRHPEVSHVAVVHCETSSGILNPLAEISASVKGRGRTLLVDSMSAFGALPVDPDTIRFDALAASSNKCLESIPGVGFVIARSEVMEASEGNSQSLSLDLHAQWTGLNRTGQWRFTPPTHVVAALLHALEEHRCEGGVEGRRRRYQLNKDTLVSGMRALGFRTLLPDAWLSPIIVTFLCPRYDGFVFERFYEMMRDRGFVLYPGKLTAADSFRMGCIGKLDAGVMKGAVKAVAETLSELGIPDGSPDIDAGRSEKIGTGSW